MNEMVELSTALTDVRRAYRLLWSYQRRALDIIRLIADGFDGHEFYLWEPVNNDRPVGRLKDPTTRWAWDMLPMGKMTYLCLPQGAERNHPKAGEWMLEITLDSDTGFSDPETGEEPDPQDFTDVAKSVSKIRLVAWQCTSSADLNWYEDVWNSTDWPDQDGELVEHSDPPFRALSKEYDLKHLADKSAVNNAVTEFKALLKAKMGIEAA
ncbi:hypothetical protein FHR70_003498 [Microvirga lupini]|uniref:Uncharacterized protein n=1 Tax=Microvirga lupini TaxID=420324 RepID=A0A7W4VPC9_9HYPH|nr:hypothetical protein [Microvirga lupini]MBB3020417.1 hypothetical protein [Microvirga lupini]